VASVGVKLESNISMGGPVIKDEIEESVTVEGGRVIKKIINKEIQETVEGGHAIKKVSTETFEAVQGVGVGVKQETFLTKQENQTITNLEPKKMVLVMNPKEELEESIPLWDE
jgi:hypothetical protein